MEKGKRKSEEDWRGRGKKEGSERRKRAERERICRKARRKEGDLKGRRGTDRKHGTGDRGMGGGVQRKTRRERSRRWRLGESKRQPGSSAALNSFDPVRLARRSSRYIPVAGWAQSARETERDSKREKLVGNLREQWKKLKDKESKGSASHKKKEVFKREQLQLKCPKSHSVTC